MRFIQLYIVLFFSCWVNAVFSAATLETLESFIKQKNYQQAWQQAQQLSKANEGDPRFDYLYGLSALETGNYDRAVFSLERVVVSQPFAARPRLELARAYMKINNSRAALREFREVLKLDPPPAVRQNVNRLMTTLSKQDKTISKHEFNGRLSAALGYDSNANFGAGSATLETPVFGAITLNALSVKQSSPFSLLQGNFNYRYVSSDLLSWFTNVGLSQKHYKDAEAFNLGQVDVSGGSLITTGQQQYQLAARKRNVWLNDTPYKQAHSVQIGAAHDFTDAGVASGVLAFEQYEYRQQPLRDGKSLTWRTDYSFTRENMRHRVQGQLSREKPDQEAGKHHARNISGLRYTLSRTWDNGHSSSISLDYSYLKHRGDDPIYARKRRDKRLALEIGQAVKLGKKTALFIDLGLVENSSNLPLYDTDKSYIQTGLSYQF